MKKTSLGLVCCFLTTISGHAANYTLNLPAGYSLIANQLDSALPGGNTLDNVIPSPPDGTDLYIWSCAGYVAHTFDALDGTWTPSGTLNPGEGAIINLPAPTAITFTGTPHVPVLPVAPPCGCNAYSLLSSQTTNAPATFQDITGSNPTEGTVLYRCNSGTTDGSSCIFAAPPFGPPCYTAYTFSGGSWAPSTPTLNLGESAWIYTPCPQASTNCCDGCTAPYPDSYTVTVYPGVENYLADNLCQWTNNTLSNLLSSLPARSVVSVWDVGAQAFLSSVKTASGWNNNFTLGPGQGFLLQIPGTTNVSLTISGCPPMCPPPCGPPTNAMVLVGDFGASAGTWTNLFGCPPPCGAQMLFFNGTGYTEYDYYGGTWHDASGNIVPAPVVAVGQSVFASVQTTNILSVTCSSPKTVQCGTNWTFDLPVASSCCGTNITFNVLQTTTNSNGTCPGTFTATRAWQIIDGCSNTATCTQTVTVVDTIAPVITGCQNIITNAVAGLNGANVSYTVAALDNCSGPVSVTCLPPSGSFFPCGTNTVQCTATDLCGNTTNCSFEVIVLCPCVGISNQVFTAVSNVPGGFTYSFNLQNNAAIPVKYLLLVPQSGCFTLKPDILAFQPPLQPAQTTNLSVLLSLTGNCGSNLCALMSLEDSNLVTCCSRQICFRLDTNAPTIQCPPPQTVCGATNGSILTLTAQATDPDGDPLTIQWFVDGTLVQYGGLTLTHTFSIGAHNIEVTAFDGQSLVSCTSTVTLLAKPVITIQLTNGQVVVSWTGGGVLQAASVVTGPYVDVPGATSPYTSPISAGPKFYRVLCP